MAHARILVTAMVLALAPAAARAADVWPVPRGPAREPVPYRYDAAAWHQVPKEFLDDAPAVTLYVATSHGIDADGTIETTTHEITRLNSRKGIDSLGEYHSIYFDPHYQKLTLNEARVLKASGKTVPIQPRHVHLRDVATDYQIYDTEKQLVISFPNLEVGDVYEVKWTVRGKNPEFDGRFFTRYNFGDDSLPIVKDELHIVAPGKMALHHKTLNGVVAFALKDAGPLKHYHWHVTNRAPLPKDADGPSKEELRLQVACSTFASWEDVGKWKQKVRAECWKCTQEVRQVVEDVTAGLKTPLDKARALTYWVRRNIRYVSRGPGGAGYTPHAPHQVLANLFGDCKDQSQLLAVMLREVGLDPHLVTFGLLDDGQVLEEVPSPWGTHGILMVPIDGKEHWIDTTVSQAAWNYLPRSDRDRLAYVTRDAKLKLMRTPPLTYQDNRIEQVTELTVRPDGSTHQRRKVVYHGAAGLIRRDAWIDTPPGERRRLLTAELQDANSRSRLLALQVDEKNLLNFEAPVQAQFEFTVARHFAGGPNKEASITDSQVWNRVLAYNLDPERRLPLHLGSPFESSHRYVIELPLAFRFDGTPKDQEVTSPFGFLKLQVRHDAKTPRRLELHMHTRLDKVRVPPAAFAAYQKFHEEVNRAYRVWLYLKPTDDVADASRLETLWALAPWSDATSPVIAGQIYLDHDKDAEARRVLAAACRIHPRDAKLWDLRVKAAATYAEEESLYLEMVKLFPDEPKHVLALGATRVRREDHAGARKVLAGLFVHASGDIRGKAHYQAARSYFQEKKYEAALKHLDLAASSDAAVLEDVLALHFKARVHEQLGQGPDAMVSYRAALAHEPDAVRTLLPLLALEMPLAQQHGLKSESLDHLRRYTLAVGKDALGLARAAEFHWQLGRLDDAWELAQRSRDVGFTAKAQRVLGLIHLGKGQYEQAVFHLDRADADARVVSGLIEASIALGDLARALKHAESGRLLADPPPHLQQKLALASGLHERSKLLAKDGVAKDDLTKEPSSAWQRAAAMFVCAERLYLEGTAPDRIRALLDRALADADLLPAYSLRALVLLDKGHLAKALTDANKALAATNPDYRAYFVRGRIRLERGQAGALSDLERAATLSAQKDGFVLHWLATALLQANRRAEALAFQRRAAELLPGNADILEQLRELTPKQD